MSTTIFYVADASKSGGFNFVLNKTKVGEAEFWNEVESKCTDLTSDRPEKHEETINLIKVHLTKGKKSNLTILDRYFERITK